MKNLTYLLSISLLCTCFLLTSCGGEDSDDPAPTNNPQDIVPPRVTSITPSNGSSNVLVGTIISINFSEEIDANSVSNTSVILSGAANSPVQYSVSVSGSVLTIRPSNNLNYEEEYSVNLNTNIVDLAGNGLLSSFTSRFTTEVEPDNIAPTVLSINPSDGATNVPVNTQIIIEFSEAVENIASETFKIRKNGDSGSLNGSGSFTNNSFTYTMDSPLTGNTTYSIFIGSGIIDLAGNNLESDVETTFTTENNDLVISSSSILDNEDGVSIDAEISVTLNQEIDVATVNSNNFYLRRFEPNGSTSNVSGSISVNGNQLSFTPDLLLTEFTTNYELIIGAGIASVDGNVKEANENISFTTELISTEYYYLIRPRSALAFFMMYNNSTGQITIASSATSNQQLWYFVFSGGNYHIGNKEAGNEQFIERGATDDGMKVFMTGTPAPGAFFRGQRFRLKRGTGEIDYLLTAPDEQSVLDFSLDMVSNTTVTISKLWRFQRSSPIN